LEQGKLDTLTYELALLEELPDAPRPLPQLATHLLDRSLADFPGKPRIHSTLDRQLQLRANQTLRRHHQVLSQNGIHNAAALIVDVQTGEIKAYVGNVQGAGYQHGESVDIIQAPRSTGSILKPFLYAAMLQSGELLPHTLVADIPSYFGRGYQPANYDRQYRGAVPASRALARSLNIPAVRMLQAHGVGKFQEELKRLGLGTLTRPASDYGLSLILGGAEATIWDLAGVYAGMARNLDHFEVFDGRYDPEAYRPPHYLASQTVSPPSNQDPVRWKQLETSSLFGAGAIWHTFQAMVEVTRPSVEAYWENFASSDRIAWKTGTSFGYRDAWSIGVTPDYVVAVWVGNADGEGRDGLVGGAVAAPILFDLFNLLPQRRRWFRAPYDDLRLLPTCRQSGHQASSFCPEVDSSWVPQLGTRSRPCPYHRSTFLDSQSGLRVHGDCASPLDMEQKVYFVLPPAWEQYYQQRHPNYRPLPPYRADCLSGQNDQGSPIQWIYPTHTMQIYLPVDLNGERGEVVFEVAHRQATSTLHWHLDDEYLGSTTEIHRMGLQAALGPHRITIVDQDGQRSSQQFEIIEQ
ncbi:MAG: penicillin-binding transpeptidase domain-containing protein, partial [Bacteroidota bacterium]